MPKTRVSFGDIRSSKPQEAEIHPASGLTSTHFPLTSMNRTQKGSDLEVTSLSRRFWPQTDSSTLQTQYWEPIGPAGEGVPVYAMDSSSSNPRQSVGHERKEKDLRASSKAGSHTKCWMQNHLQGFPGSQAPALPGHHPHTGAVPGFLSGSSAEQQNPVVALLHK